MHHCNICNRSFANGRDYLAHSGSAKHASRARSHDSSLYIYCCGLCNGKFSSLEALGTHVSNVHTSYNVCKKRFANAEELQQHMGSDYCDVCNTTFKCGAALQQHTKSSVHQLHHCDECNISVIGRKAFTKHLKTGTHEQCSQFRCCDCSLDLNSHVTLLAHLNGKSHKRKLKKQLAASLTCKSCDKVFKTTTALENHASSIVHRPLCDPLPCIASAQCKIKFHAPSAMISHLESGACASGLSRQSINKLIMAYDEDRMITKCLPQASPDGPQSLLDDSSDMESDSGVMLTQTSSSRPTMSRANSWADGSSDTHSDWEVVLTPTSSPRWAIPGVNLRDFISGDHVGFSDGDILSAGAMTPESNGGQLSISDLEISQIQRGYICHLCPRQQFATAAALKQHRASAAHAPRIFQCPVSLIKDHGKANHRKSFSTLSGLAMHVESGACGTQTIRKVLTFVNEKLKAAGFREMKLLG